MCCCLCSHSETRLQGLVNQTHQCDSAHSALCCGLPSFLTESCLSCFTPDSVYLAFPSLFLSRALPVFSTYCRSGPYHLIDSVWQILPPPNQMPLARWLSVHVFWLRGGELSDNACMWYWKEPPSPIGVFLGHDSFHRCRHVFVMATDTIFWNVIKSSLN